MMQRLSLRDSRRGITTSEVGVRVNGHNLDTGLLAKRRFGPARSLKPAKNSSFPRYDWPGERTMSDFASPQHWSRKVLGLVLLVANGTIVVKASTTRRWDVIALCAIGMCAACYGIWVATSDDQLGDDNG